MFRNLFVFRVFETNFIFFLRCRRAEDTAAAAAAGTAPAAAAAAMAAGAEALQDIVRHLNDATCAHG